MAKPISVEDFEPQNEQVVYGSGTTIAGEAIKPKYGSRAWHDFIMSQFHEDELFNGCPKVDGLRRVAEEFLGEIVVSRPDLVDTPRSDNGYRYVASHELVIIFPDGKQRLFSELADVDLKGVNTPEEYAKHPTATASSKAESRALRKALKLRTLAAEELGNPEYKDDEGMDFLIDDTPTEITTTQQSFIEFKCEKLGIDLKKLLDKSKAGYKKLEDLSYKDAERTIKYLNEIQTNKKDIPAGIAKEV